MLGSLAVRRRSGTLGGSHPRVAGGILARGAGMPQFTADFRGPGPSFVYIV